MRTLPRNRPKDSPYGDRPAQCSYCGATWMRSNLRRDGSGLLACPLDYDGRDVVTLNTANAKAAQSRRGYRDHLADGAPIKHQTDVAIPLTAILPYIPTGGKP